MIVLDIVGSIMPLERLLGDDVVRSKSPLHKSRRQQSGAMYACDRDGSEILGFGDFIGCDHAIVHCHITSLEPSSLFKSYELTSL